MSMYFMPAPQYHRKADSSRVNLLLAARAEIDSLVVMVVLEFFADASLADITVKKVFAAANFTDPTFLTVEYLFE